MEISPSPVAPVCQEGDQLELTCNTTGIDHRWEFVIFPENVSHTTTPVTSIGVSGIPQPLMISFSTITFSRLSGQNVLPLISRVTIDPVSSDLNRTVVNCIEGMNSLVSTTITQIIDSRQFGKTPQYYGRDICMYVYIGYYSDCPNLRSMNIHLAYNQPHTTACNPLTKLIII